MKHLLKIISYVWAFSLPMAYAAHEHSYTTGENSAPEWLSSELLGQGVSVEPYGALVGSTKEAQVGWFSNLVSEVTSCFTNGVILSTGNISHGAFVTNYSNCTSWGDDENMNSGTTAGRDKDLARSYGISEGDLCDVAGLVLYVVPQNKTINIPFMMASEEFFYPFDDEEVANYKVPYDSYTYADYSDKFAFFLKKGKIATGADARDMGFYAADDIARLPDGSMVEIASINQYTNQSYFVANVVTNGPNDRGADELNLVFPTGEMPIPMEYNGVIIGPTAVCTNVEPGQIYTIKIVISDYGDPYNNSVIFLKDHGITSGADLKVDATGPTFINEPGSVVFTNTVSNIGPATADGVVVTNYLPVGAVVNSKTHSSGSVVSTKIGESDCLVWTVGDRFAPGSNAVMTVTCNLPEIGSYTNSAEVVTSTGDYDEKNNSAECVTTVGTPPATPITVSAISTNMVYGSSLGLADLQFISSIEGTNGTETVSGINVAFLDGAGDVVSPSVATVGTYRIVLSNISGTGLPPPAMTTYVEGKLTIGKREIEITPRNRTKEYGQSFVLSGKPNEIRITKGTLVNGDSIFSVKLASEGTAPTAPWRESYEITASDAQGTGLGNYQITFGKGKLGVLKFKLTITANDTNKVYGTTVAFAGTEFTTTPEKLPNGEKIETVELTSEKASDPATAAGTYEDEIVPFHEVTGINTNNYDITFSNGTLRVTKAALAIIADDTNKVYNTTITFAGTEFTTIPAELPNGDEVTSVTLTSEKAASAATPAGEYKKEIVPSDAEGTGLGNYAITYSNGTLRVTKAALAIIADDTNKVYGTTVTFAGTEFTTIPAELPNGDEVTSVTLTSEKAANAATPAGEYKKEIVPSDPVGTGLANYAITYSNGTLRVTKAELTITANDATNCYGEAMSFTGKEFTTVPTTLPNGDLVETVTLTNLKPIDTVVGKYEEAIEPSHEVTGINTNNYNIVFSNGTLTVTQALLTVSVNDTTYHIRKEWPPRYSFADFSSQLKADDTIADVTGGSGLATDVAYTNAYWKTAVPAEGDEGVYTNEIWATLESFDGPRAANYLITVDPGDLTVDTALPEFKITMNWTLNWDTGLFDGSLTIKNEGDGEAEADADYWVELKPGEPATGTKTAVSQSYYLASKTGTIPDGYDYQDLTAQVKAALKAKYGHEVFNPGEEVTVSGVSIYHWKRYSPDKFIDAEKFFVFGQLFNVADTDQDFRISTEEKDDAAPILGESSAAYTEVTYLYGLEYYHWKMDAGTWRGPSK